jgi:hypothetical protein
MTRDEHFSLGPAGWQTLLRELDAELQKRWPDYTVEQVKEKFGTLRFYADPGLEIPDFTDDEAGTAAHNQWYVDNVDAFHDLIHLYEDKTATICERCGNPGKLGSAGYWWSTRCSACAPDGWVANDVQCDHPSIVDATCVDCGRQRLTRLEHTDQVLANVHPEGTCLGEWCTIHNRSDHAMRAFPQAWRSDRALMERICPHGVGHPDPDDCKLSGPRGLEESVHGCDGCCTGGAR